MNRCPRCRHLHAYREALELAQTLRAAHHEGLGALRAAARRVTLELEGHCDACTFRLAADLNDRSPPRLALAGRPSDAEIEQRYLDGFESAEVGRGGRQ